MKMTLTMASTSLLRRDKSAATPRHDDDDQHRHPEIQNQEEVSGKNTRLLVRQLVRQLEKAEVRCCAAEETAVHQQRYIAMLEDALARAGGDADGVRAAAEGHTGGERATSTNLANAVEIAQQNLHKAASKIEQLENALHEQQLLCLAKENRISSLTRELDEQHTIAQFCTINEAASNHGDDQGATAPPLQCALADADADADRFADAGSEGTTEGGSQIQCDEFETRMESPASSVVEDSMDSNDGEADVCGAPSISFPSHLLDPGPPLDLCVSGFDFRHIVETLFSLDEPMREPSCDAEAQTREEDIGESGSTQLEDKCDPAHASDESAREGEASEGDVDCGLESIGSVDEPRPLESIHNSPQAARHFRVRSSSSAIRRRLSQHNRLARGRAASLGLR